MEWMDTGLPQSIKLSTELAGNIMRLARASSTLSLERTGRQTGRVEKPSRHPSSEPTESRKRQYLPVWKCSAWPWFSHVIAAGDMMPQAPWPPGPRGRHLDGDADLQVRGQLHHDTFATLSGVHHRRHRRLSFLLLKREQGNDNTSCPQQNECP